MSRPPEGQRLNPSTLVTTVSSSQPSTSVEERSKEEITCINYDQEEKKKILIVPGFVENKLALIAMDTCSTASLISLDLAKKLKRSWVKDSTCINTLANRVSAEGRIYVKVKIAQEEIEVACLIVKSLPSDLLLGNDALSVLKPKIDYQRMKVKIGEEHLGIDLAATSEDFTLALVAEETRIPAFSTKFVKLKPNRPLPDATEVLFEPMSSYLSSRALTVMENREACISIMNLSNRELVIPTEEPIGRFEKISSSVDCHVMWNNGQEGPEED